jgi:hypothetical protein
MKTLIAFLLSLALSSLGKAQSDSALAFLGLPKLPPIQKEFLLGVNTAFAKGEYVNYVESFSHVPTDELTTVNLKVLPKISPVIGIQYRMIIPDSIFKNKLSITLGGAFFTRGMVSIQETTVIGDSLATNDKQIFKDHLKATYLSIPLSVRYGQKIFGELGVSYDRFLFATRQLKSKRSISGDDAYEGGFSNTERSMHFVKSDLFAPANWSVHIGGGLQINSKSAIALHAKWNPRTFVSGNDLKNTNVQIRFMFNL